MLLRGSLALTNILVQSLNDLTIIAGQMEIVPVPPSLRF